MLWLLVPSLLFVALYARTLPYEFVWMDKREIQEGTLIRAPERLAHAFLEPFHNPEDARVAGINQPYYRPLQVVAVSLVHAAVGKRPAFYRAVALAAGALSCAALALFVWLASGRLGAGVFAGAFLAAHPAAIEVHVWIAALSEALVVLPCLLALIAALLALRREGLPAWRWGAASILSLIVGLLAKENAAVLPLLMTGLAISLVCMDRGPGALSLVDRARRLAPRALPLLASAYAVVALYVIVWRPLVLGGFAGRAPFVGGSLLTQWLTAASSWPRAIAWLVFPVHASTSDTTRIVTSPSDFAALLGIALALGSAVLWVLALRRGRGLAALGIFWVWVAYLPTSNLVPILHPWAERYVFLSVCGLALILIDVVPDSLARLPGWRPVFSAGLAALVVLALAQRSVARASDWRDGRVLFEHDVARDPLYREGRYELALELSERGQFREARELLGPVLEPSLEMLATTGFWDEGSTRDLDCYFRLAQGLALPTIDYLQRLAADRPGLAGRPAMRFCLGRAQEMADRPALALETYQSIVETGGGESNALLRVALARTYATLGRPMDARRWLRTLPPEARRDRTIDREVREVEGLLQAGARGRARAGGR